MNLKWLLAIATLIPTTASAAEADWWIIGHTGTKPHREVQLLDDTTVHMDSLGQKSVWTYMVLETPSSDGVAYMMARVIVQCLDRKMKVASLHSFDVNHGPKSSENSPAEWTDVLPHTAGEEQLNIVCGEGYGTSVHIGQGKTMEEAAKIMWIALDQMDKK